MSLKDELHPQDGLELLLAPLEFISTIDEPKIRDVAVSSVLALVADRSPTFFEEHYFMMVCRLVLWEDYASKVSGAALIPLCF